MTFVLVTFLVCRAQAGRLAASFATAAAVVGAASGLSPRPQTVSLVLIPVVVHLWLRTADDLRPRWVLIPLMWIWALLHGYWLVGVAIGVVGTVALVARGRARGRSASGLGLLCAGSALITLVTPVGPRLTVAALTVNERSQFITEWQHPSFLSLDPWPATAMVALAAVILFRRRKLDLVRGLLLAMAMFWIIYAVRTVSVGAVIAAPVLAEALGHILPKDSTSSRRETAFLASIAAAALIIVALVSPSGADKPGDNFPNRLDRSLEALPAGTTVFNSSELGGWIEWRHPRLNVVIDGVFDAYQVDYIEKVRDAALARPGWEDFLKKTDSRAALISRTSPLAGPLRAAGWVDVGDDAGYVMLVSPRS